MQTPSPYKAAIRPALDAAKVMVKVIAGTNAPLIVTPAKLTRWRRLTPLALWCAVPVRDAGPDAILHGVVDELARQGVQPHQLILLVEGKTGRAALELVLQGALACAAILAIAVPCTALPFAIVPTAAAIRLVVDCEDTPADLIRSLRAADIDARIIRLDPQVGCDARTVANAAETFVLELVANASRQTRHGV
jgi:hypothetical protein